MQDSLKMVSVMAPYLKTTWGVVQKAGDLNSKIVDIVHS
jgi:hypothetical protein